MTAIKTPTRKLKFYRGRCEVDIRMCVDPIREALFYLRADAAEEGLRVVEGGLAFFEVQPYLFDSGLWTVFARVEVTKE